MIPSKNTSTNREQQMQNYSLKNNCYDWILVQKTGTISFRLGTADITVIGSEGCDINIQSPSVEKRHAVLFFDPKSTHFTVKDLQSTNGTYVNERRLPPQAPAKLNNMDLLRFGYDSNLYEIRKGNNNTFINGSGRQLNSCRESDGLMSERPQLVKSMSDFGKLPTTIVNTPTSEPRSGGGSGSSTPSSDRLSRHVIQGVRATSSTGNGSRGASPSFTLDSGHGSNSTLSSPAKEMSPLPNSISSNANSPVPQHSEILNQEFGLPHYNSEELELSQSLCVSENGKIRKDSLEDVAAAQTEGGMLDSALATSAFGKRDSHPLLFIDSDLSVPNEVFQPEQQTQSMSSAANRNAKPTVTEKMARSHSFTNGESSALSSLYGTPHWWPIIGRVSHGRDNSHSTSPFCKKSRSELELPKDGCEDKGGKCDVVECGVKEQNNEKSDSDSASTATSKKLSPMAFTVDFGDAAADTTKRCFGITDSISRFVPRHRRNLSLTKGDVMGNKNEEQKTMTATASVSSSKFHRKASLETTDQSSSSGGGCNKPLNISGKYSKESSSSSHKIIKESPSASALTKRDQKLSPSASEKPRATIIPTSSTQKLRNDNSIKVSNNNATTTSEKKDSKQMADLHGGGDDTTSETGTYTIKKETAEVQQARKSIDTVFGTKTSRVAGSSPVADKDISGDPASLAWVREWAESAAQLQQTSPNESTADSETRFFLQETENLVSAMQERMSNKISNNNSGQNSDCEEESSKLYKQHERLRQKAQAQARLTTEKNVVAKRGSPLHREASVLSDSGYALGYASDSSNEGSGDAKLTGVKCNRAFAIRRSRLVGYDSDGCSANAKNRQSLTLPVRGVSPRPQVVSVAGCSRPPLPSPSPPPLSRNDGGRFSLRVSHKSKSPPEMLNANGCVSTGGAYNHLRMTTAPVSASANRSDLNVKKTSQPIGLSRKPPSAGESRSNSTLTSKEVEFANWKRRKSYNPMRAAAQGRRKDGANGNGSLKNDDDSEASEGGSRRNGQLIKSGSLIPSRYVSGNSEDEELTFAVDEMESSHSNSPNQLSMSRSLHEDMYGVTHQSPRSRNKLEALDNLVIATIHSLSVKVRTSSRHLLEKLQLQHSDDENGALLDEMVSQLKDLEVNNSANSSPTKNSSRELSGTLKNLKKLEQVILVLDRILCDDDSEETN